MQEAPDISERGGDSDPAEAEEGKVLLRLVGATKRFGGTVAIHNVSFDIRAGEVLALLGENGAGKSTCVKVLAGVYPPNEGSVEMGGKARVWDSPLSAQRAGIAVMHQHPGLFPDLSVAENIFFGRFPETSLGVIDTGAMADRAAEILDTIGLDVSPSQPLRTLSVSEQQLVEVARALSSDADILIMDEPTAALSHREVQKLFAVVAQLKARGVGIVFVGHRMDEIFDVSDRIAVLRDGELLTVEPADVLTRQDAINLMAGRTLVAGYPERDQPPGDVILQVEDLSRAGEYSGISFNVRAGEVLGIGGLVGSGRTEVARTIFGITRPSSGDIAIDGAPVRIGSPGEAMRKGIAYVSEDRLSQSLIAEFPIFVNGSLTVLERCTHHGLLQREREIGAVKEQLERLKLRYASFDQEISGLSGGNQQKVVLAKWVATRPRILILDEPTQGIDVQSKAEVHAMIADLARQGLAIVLISSEMPELLGMCDRIVVLNEGRQVATFDRAEATAPKVLEAATRSAAPVDAGPETHEVPEAPAQQSFAQSLRNLLKRREVGLLVAILAVIIPVTIINPRMMSPANLTPLTMDAALLGFVALGQMLVILTRNIDLSVASVIGLTAYTSAGLMSANPELPAIAGVAFACVLGAGLGSINGLIIAYGRVPSIVATLGTMSIFRGLHSLWAGGDQISADEVPAHWLALAGTEVLGIPLIVLLAVVVLAVAAFVLSRTRWGRELYGVGSNPGGADLIGIPSTRRIFSAFVLAGALAGLTGALWASRYATVDARVAFGFELTVVAAVVVGGVAIRGGSGTVLGIVLGALALLIIRNGLVLVRVDPLWLQGIYGLVILVAITIDAKIAARHERRLQRRATP
ncbi:ATP-binding cassette domain-containing protein [Acuticoccus sp. MNP-M23]|uniref:ATP-binding cassette domain-containing protein n=1 Tax=Acuticoccus sp. MNP-M23 TaxID=3072793 RepID=UPI00281645E4|nr:ATP-binding cassette domain-containing protein [Acuticoccus sp. MNP-M23]WMS44593.1 ATP-binding cassette domain-containing protein [Acuticoccus sp. MNP-M23]